MNRPKIRIRWSRATALFVGAMSAVPAVAGPVAPCAPDGGAVAGVASVRDGATLVLADGRVVRLAGIDAPESPLALDAGSPSPLADAARDELARLALGREVSLVPADARPDRYGRVRANAFLTDDGAWLQQGLVRAGLARVHRIPGDPACVLALIDDERDARAQNRLIWGDFSYRVRDATDPSLARRTGLYELVEGRVASIGHGDYMVFVDFGRDYRTDFTVMITPAMADKLVDAGIAVDALEGRRVLVRGMIEASGGPAIRLGDPADLAVLDDGDD